MLTQSFLITMHLPETSFVILMHYPLDPATSITNPYTHYSHRSVAIKLKVIPLANNNFIVY